MTRSFLTVQGEHITLDGKPIILKGAGLGGWSKSNRWSLSACRGQCAHTPRPVNMENFITGYPGHEYQVRAALRNVLGEEKYEYFFDKFLEYFFTEDDAAFFASLGLNCIRLPVSLPCLLFPCRDQARSRSQRSTTATSRTTTTRACSSVPASSTSTA